MLQFLVFFFKKKKKPKRLKELNMCAKLSRTINATICDPEKYVRENFGNIYNFIKNYEYFRGK